MYTILHTINCAPEWILQAHLLKKILSSSRWTYAEFAKGANFLGAGRVTCREAACDAWRSQAFADSCMLPRENVLNGAIWCVLEHIFITFLL